VGYKEELSAEHLGGHVRKLMEGNVGFRSQIWSRSGRGTVTKKWTIAGCRPR
jgi:hypothetical protein